MLSFEQWLAHVADLLTVHDPVQAGFIGLLVGWTICPGYMYFLAVVSEWRWPRYHDQFKAFMPGNLFLGVVFGCACYLDAAYRRSGGVAHVYRSSLWMWLPLAVAAILVVALSAMDIAGAFTYREGDTTKYHWLQLISWTKIWHNVGVYGAYGYLLIRVGVPGLSAAAWASVPNDITRLLLIACLVRWVRYLIADGREPKFATGHVRVNVIQWCVGLVAVVATCVILAAI